MHITELRIRNFRSFSSARFAFTKGVNTLIGENGAGKTNVFYAMRLILDESLSRNAVNLNESDFNRSLSTWKGEWITISIDFDELDYSEGCQMLRHATGSMNGMNKGTCSFVFRPNRTARESLFKASTEEYWDEAEKAEALLQIRDSLTIDNYEAVITGRGNADFLDEITYHQLAGSFETLIFPDPSEEDTELFGGKYSGTHQEVACTFVRALRDVVRELKQSRTNPLLTLLRGMESEITLQEAESIVQSVRSLNSQIGSLEEISSLASNIEKAIRDAVGNTYGLGIDINSALPDTIESILQKLNIMVGDNPDSSYRGDIEEQSLGGANLLYLALKILEYESKLATDRVAHFLLIEEPEAHIHPHVQKTLFSKLPIDRTQVIVSTHSTNISSVAKIESVNVLARKEDIAEVYQPANNLSPEITKKIQRYLDAIRSNLLFAKGVVLVEGDAEQILVPAMMRAGFGVSPDELGFSVIGMGSAFFEHIAVLFSEDRIRRRCAIVTDLDQSLIELPENEVDDSKIQASARMAQMLGLSRKRKLEASFFGNEFVKPFFAKYTFEADLIIADNKSYFCEVAEDHYSSRARLDMVLRKLNSDLETTSGSAAISLAKKIGKGWFALLISEKLDLSLTIPDYLIESIAFACFDSIQVSTIRQMGEFRINENPNDDLTDFKAGIVVEEGESHDEAFVRHYMECWNNDDLTRLVHQINAFRLL